MLQSCPCFSFADERRQLVPDDADLNAELLRMTDAFTDELFPPTAHEAARIVFPVSRLVCDVERFPDDQDEPMSARGMGAVYTLTSTGSPLRADLTPAERDRIISRWNRPHHARLTEAVDDALAGAGNCLVIDGHSFSPHPMPHEPDQAPDRPDICIGTDPFHTPPDLTAALAEAAMRLGFSVAIDRPFSGALVPAKHYRQDARIRSIMIEVNRRLYMDERTGERVPGFDRVAEAVRDTLLSTAASDLDSCVQPSALSQGKSRL